jgi:hypothetical protein
LSRLQTSLASNGTLESDSSILCTIELKTEKTEAVAPKSDAVDSDVIEPEPAKEPAAVAAVIEPVKTEEIQKEVKQEEIPVISVSFGSFD